MSFAYDKGKSFIIFDCETSTVTFWNITFAYGSASLKLFAQALFSSFLRTGTAGPDSTTLGDYILIWTWSGEKFEPFWEEPHQVLLTTETAVHTAETDGPTHYWIKRAPKEEQWTESPEPGNTKVTLKRLYWDYFPLGNCIYHWCHPNFSFDC
jgi:hypothetical protein